MAVGAIGTLIAYIYFEQKHKNSPEAMAVKIQTQQQAQQIQEYKTSEPIVVVNILPPDDKIAKQLHKKELYGYVRTDQAEQYSVIASPSLDYQHIIITLKGFVPNIDLDNILVASGIAQADKNNDSKLSQQLYRNMKDRFGIRGIQIYNRLISDNLFEKRLLPKLQDLMKQYPTADMKTIEKVFSEYYETFLTKLADVTWVSKHQKESIIRRNLTSGIEMVRKAELDVFLVFGKGTTVIDRIRIIANEILQMVDGLEMKEIAETNIGGEPARMFRIYKKA